MLNVLTLRSFQLTVSIGFIISLFRLTFIGFGDDYISDIVASHFNVYFTYQVISAVMVYSVEFISMF